MHLDLMATRQDFDYNLITRIIRAIFSTYSFTGMFARTLLSLTWSDASGGCAFKTSKTFHFVATGKFIFYCVCASHIFTVLATKARTWVTTTKFSIAFLLAFNIVGIITAPHLERVASCAVEWFGHFLTAFFLTTFL